ncbi:MAG: periplasmic heavy metal sensor [Rickettsiales bacterium]|nr:periplasmic heavy metal sensor [Rickettsiales bacterium]
MAFLVCLFGSHAWQTIHMPDAHQNLHEHLGITAEQEKRLEPIEQRFQARKTELTQAINDANSELGTAIIADKSYSERVKKAVEEIHHAQGELQKQTLEHLFEMQTVLTPEQSEKLDQLAADALIHRP